MSPLSGRLSRELLGTTLALALAAAVSLGLARFSYAVLLPAMRSDLGWSYATAGAMNTLNAAGYLLGALLLPALMRRFDTRRVVVAGGVLAALLLMAHGAVRSDAALYGLRLLTGAASALGFAGGGVLAAQLAQRPEAAGRSGLVLGLYYGGTGVGIVLCALGLPGLIEPAEAWPQAWWALGVTALLCTLVMATGTARLTAPASGPAGGAASPLAPLAWGLIGYLLFGLGYIGYMTFVVTLLREMGFGRGGVMLFYAVLGCGVMASSFLWANLLSRHRNGRPMAQLNGLLALATALPVLPGVGAHPAAVLLSGALFGGVFLSVVASTTALVRHNLPKAAWPRGIAAFTIVFAAGQIVGPIAVGLLSDAMGGLAGGFWVSAGLLAVGSWAASRQRALVVG